MKTTRSAAKATQAFNPHFSKSATCFHGGAFFGAIGEKFEALDRHRQIINADVLDAWFPPSPAVTAALEEHLPWLLRTSPPTGCEGMIEVIARMRGVEPECILPGAGSSDLIFLTLRQWLNSSSRALILDPTYGEYAHVLERVIGCRVDRLVLSREENYRVNLQDFETQLARGYDLVVLVNPNSPTGQHISRRALEEILRRAPTKTKFWVDETYVEYANASESLEQFAMQTMNVVVCKSMSKVYALSGVRAAYLCAAPELLEPLRLITPPWAVGLPGQVAAVKALQDPDYYEQRYDETHIFRQQLAEDLASLGIDVIPSIGNFLLCHLPIVFPEAAEIVNACREQNLFLRDASVMGRTLGKHALRIAVKDSVTNRRMIEILSEVLDPCLCNTPTCKKPTLAYR